MQYRNIIILFVCVDTSVFGTHFLLRGDGSDIIKTDGHACAELVQKKNVILRYRSIFLLLVELLLPPLVGWFWLGSWKVITWNCYLNNAVLQNHTISTSGSNIRHAQMMSMPSYNSHSRACAHMRCHDVSATARTVCGAIVDVPDNHYAGALYGVRHQVCLSDRFMCTSSTLVLGGCWLQAFEPWRYCDLSPSRCPLYMYTSSSTKSSVFSVSWDLCCHFRDIRFAVLLCSTVNVSQPNKYAPTSVPTLASYFQPIICRSVATIGWLPV